MRARFDFATYDLLPAEEQARLRDHPLRGASGAEIPGGITDLRFGPRIIGGRYFRVHLGAGPGAPRFVTGLHNSGRYPGQNWIEVIDLDLP
ncbi:MAG: hypothetical protein ACYDGR_15495, partial [Candidatus Dormibacteria bacterium]